MLDFLRFVIDPVIQYISDPDDLPTGIKPEDINPAIKVFTSMDRSSYIRSRYRKYRIKAAPAAPVSAAAPPRDPCGARENLRHDFRTTTERAWQKTIFDANRERLTDANNVDVGILLTIPGINRSREMGTDFFDDDLVCERDTCQACRRRATAAAGGVLSQG